MSPHGTSQSPLDSLELDKVVELVDYSDISGIANFCAIIAKEEIRGNWPSFPEAALPQSGRLAYGRGVERERARLSAYGEFIELASICRWGDEPILQMPSDSSEIYRMQWDEIGSANASPPAPAVTDCATLANPSGGPDLLVPMDTVYIRSGSAATDTSDIRLATSNGCACGDTPEAARKAALMELIERDATARWWYGRRTRPLLPFNILNPDFEQVLTAHPRTVRLFDITSDLSLPCVAALSCNADGSAVALGFSAKDTLRDAAVSAVLEMLQTETALLTAIKSGTVGHDQALWLDRVDVSAGFLAGSESYSDVPKRTLADITSDELTALLAAEGCEIYFLDQSRAEFELPVFRAVSPQLCALDSRETRRRLLAPDEGDRSAVLDERNPLPLLV